MLRNCVDVLMCRGFEFDLGTSAHKNMAWLQTLHPLILALHFTVSLFLIVVILLQAGKGADMSATFGAGSSQTFFGARGAATFLSKLTTVGAVVFLLTSITLATLHKNRLSSENNGSVFDTSVPARQAPASTDSKEEKTPEKK